MSSSVNLQDFQIPLKELKRATNNFDSSTIENDDDGTRDNDDGTRDDDDGARDNDDGTRDDDDDGTKSDDDDETGYNDDDDDGTGSGDDADDGTGSDDDDDWYRSSCLNFKDFRIPLKELKRATNNFDSSTIKNGGYVGTLAYRAAFIKRYNKEEYKFHELQIVSRLDNEHISSFIGYCDEDENYIYTAYEYNRHKSLDTNVCGAWPDRLKICIKVAEGLNYLHSGVGELGRVIHGDVKCENIRCGWPSLDEMGDEYSYEDLPQIIQPVIKVCGFKHSKLVPLHQPHQYHSCPEELFKKSHTDPIYKETNLINVESDVYSFGVLMFEVLHGTGSQSDDKDRDENLRQLMDLVRRCYDEGPYKLVDPDLKGNFSHRSLHIFATLAYKCISFDIKERPRMDEIIKTIQKALDVQNNEGSASEIAQRFLVNSSIPRNLLGDGPEAFERCNVRCNDGGLFFERWTSEEMSDEGTNDSKSMLLLISNFHHENITPATGVRNRDRGLIIAWKYALNGSLYSKLETQNENSYLTWAERLKICLGAARGLKYFHAGVGELKVIHGDFKSKNILLYDNLEAKICGFDKSFLVPRSSPGPNEYQKARGSEYYMDPVYRETRIPRVESNVYSFGVVLFEVLTGILACNHPVEDEHISMINWVRSLYNDKTDKLVDSRIRDEIDPRCLYIFKHLAYKCINFNMKDRPSMNQVIKRLEQALYIQTHGAATTVTRKNPKLEDFRILLKDINLAIEAKGQETLGEGGFGVVYKGQLSEHWQNRTVAIKYQYPKSDHEERVFRNELNMIFSFSHENIIPFIGYCEEGEEKIIVYEFASNGSLDCHLEVEDKRRDLTWERRLKICLGAARGLEYLHSGLGEDENSVIHRDVKSGNILLDHNLVAKICDFGLSKAGPINKQQTKVYTNTAGTNFYMDPVYHESGVLHKVSDVYSFGVVMFELLSGLPVYYGRSIGDSEDKLMLHLVRRYYDHKPDLLIDPLIKDQIDNRSFNAYREVAYQCISFNSKERPTMEMIVDRVEEALELQVTNQGDLKQKVTKS